MGLLRKRRSVHGDRVGLKRPSVSGSGELAGLREREAQLRRGAESRRPVEAGEVRVIEELRDKWREAFVGVVMALVEKARLGAGEEVGAARVLEEMGVDPEVVRFDAEEEVFRFGDGR